jgi:hypothetical protein
MLEAQVIGMQAETVDRDSTRYRILIGVPDDRVADVAQLGPDLVLRPNRWKRPTMNKFRCFHDLVMGDGQLDRHRRGSRKCTSNGV